MDRRSQGDDVPPDMLVATAILDRVLEHADIFRMNGKSYRLRWRSTGPTDNEKAED